MLDVSAINGHVLQELRGAISELRRFETNPTTIRVLPRAGSYSIVDFHDARFMSDMKDNPTDGRIATLRYESGEYVLRSHRIHNNKFNPHSGGHRERVTRNGRVMQKLLRECITPLTITEIINMTDDAILLYDRWVDQPDSQVRDIFEGGVDFTLRDDLMEEIIHFNSIGVEMRTPRFRKITAEAIPLHEEHKRRAKLKVTHAHVYVDPDGKVSVTTAERGESVKSWGTTTYANMEEVPKNIQQQICILKLVDKNTYVPEVGQCMAEGIYWVHLFPTS